MKSGNPIHKSHHDRKIFIAAFLSVIVSYIVDSATDAVLEQEDFFKQMFSPTHLLVLGFLLLTAGYVVAVVVRNRTLKKSHQHQLAAMESSMDGIAIFDGGGKLVYSNAAHLRLFGYGSNAEIGGKSWHDFYTVEEMQRFLGEVTPALQESGQWQGEALGKKRDGSPFLMDISLTRLGDGSTIRIVRDATQRKKHQMELERTARELQESNRELKTFSYSLSHDMRGHITRISSSAQLFAELYREQTDERGRFLLGAIVKGAEDMEQLIESIQMLTALSHATPRLEPVNLSEMVAAIAAEVSLTDPERRVQFVVQPDVHAHCDPKLIKVALHNLLTNAWKYTGMVAEAKIEFGVESLADPAGRNALFVRDNGMGFSSADAGKLFQPFLRLEKAREFPGTGVGLAMVQRVLEMHDGEVWAVGEPGKSATFYFTLPTPHL